MCHYPEPANLPTLFHKRFVCQSFLSPWKFRENSIVKPAPGGQKLISPLFSQGGGSCYVLDFPLANSVNQYGSVFFQIRSTVQVFNIIDDI
jgi:hypothetical protein